MRRMVSQTFIKLVKSIAEWVNGLKEILIHNKETNTTEFGGNVEIDGNTKVNGNIAIEEFSKIVDHNGHQIGKDLEDAVNGENTIEVVFTEDDWNEDNSCYVKNVQINNSFIHLDLTGCDFTLHDNNNIQLNCPYIKGCSTPDSVEISGMQLNSIEGILVPPSDRYINLNSQDGVKTYYLSIFSGVVSLLATEL